MKAYYRITITVLCISLLICLLSFSSFAADAVTEEIPVTWRRIDAISNLIDYCSQNIYFYRQGGNTQIDSTHAMTTSYNRYYGLLTQRTAAIINPDPDTFTITSQYWGNGREIYPYLDYIVNNDTSGQDWHGYNLTSSNDPLYTAPIYFVGTGQKNFPTWKQKIELNSDYPVSDGYSAYGRYSYPSMVALRLFADVDIVKLSEYDYINFAYEYTSVIPSGVTSFNNQVNNLLSDPNRYAASIGYVENGYFVPLVYADSQYSSYNRYIAGVHNNFTGDAVRTTQTIDFNLPAIVNAYNDRFSLNLTVEEFKNDFPTLTVGVTYWHIVYDFLSNGSPVASLQYFGRYNLPVVYLSNYNPVTVAISQVNQRLDQISDSLFIVQDAGDVQIINNLAEKISESTGVVSDFDSAVAAIDSIIGSVKPETNVIVNAFSTGEGASGAGEIFGNSVDVKSFLSGEYIMPLFLIAISVSVISWVIYGKRSG